MTWKNYIAQSKKMEHLGRLVITYTMVIKDRWQMQMVKMTPRERFLNFVIKNPELMQRVPQKYLASLSQYQTGNIQPLQTFAAQSFKESCSVIQLAIGNSN